MEALYFTYDDIRLYLFVENKKMKEGKVEKILNLLQGGAEMTASLLDVFLCDYNTSYKKMRKVINGQGSSYFKTNWADAYRERQRFYSLLNKLKKEGLVTKELVNMSSQWSITKKGLGKLQTVKPYDYSGYKKRSNGFCVVIFDIPEKAREKREWLRFALMSLNFSLLQNSVWIGENIIPEQLIYDLKEKKMINYVHIFGMGDQGTVKRLFTD